MEVLETVDRTPDALGVVPIETSIDGELMSVVDRVLFATSRVLFSGEAVLSESIAVFAARSDAQPRGSSCRTRRSSSSAIPISR